MLGLKPLHRLTHHGVTQTRNRPGKGENRPISRRRQDDRDFGGLAATSGKHSCVNTRHVQLVNRKPPKIVLSNDGCDGHRHAEAREAGRSDGCAPAQPKLGHVQELLGLADRRTMSPVRSKSGFISPTTSTPTALIVLSPERSRNPPRAVDAAAFWSAFAGRSSVRGATTAEGFWQQLRVCCGHLIA
jgi:hypothetical protein